MAKIYLALGSNVGDKTANLKNAVKLLRDRVNGIKQSLVYETKPYGYEKQDNFLNMAIEGSTNLSPRDLLEFVKEVEQKVGRVQTFKWGPREIDIDILFYDDQVYHDAKIDIPHKGIQERDFVLRPLMDLSPELLHPVYNKTVTELYSEISRQKLLVLGAGKKL